MAGSRTCLLMESDSSLFKLEFCQHLTTSKVGLCIVRRFMQTRGIPQHQEGVHE